MLNKKKLLLLSLLIANNKLYLQDPASDTIMELMEKNIYDHEKKNDEENDADEFSNNLKKVFTPTELGQLQISLEEQLKRIEEESISENLKKIKTARILALFSYYSIKQIEYKTSPIFFVSPNEMRDFEYSEFQYIPNNSLLKSKIDKLTGSKFLLMIDTIKLLNNQEELKLDDLRLSNEENQELQNYKEILRRLENSFGSILSFKKKDISEITLHKLGSTYNMNFNGAESFLLERCNLTENQKKILYGANISHYWRQYLIAKDEEIKVDFSLDKKKFFENIENIKELCYKLYFYNEIFLKKISINVTDLLKFLAKQSVVEQNELSQKISNTDNFLMRQLKNEKKTGIYVESNEAFKDLLRMQGNTNKSINKQENLGTQTLEMIEDGFFKYKLENRFDWKKLETAITMHLINNNENSIDNKKLNEFEAKNKRKLPSFLGKIDRQVEYIYNALYNPKNIDIKKNQPALSSTFETMMEPYFKKYENIEEYATNLNRKNPLALNLLCMNKFKSITNSMNYALNSVEKVKFSPNILCSLLREPLNQLIHENIQDSAKIIKDGSMTNTIKLVSPKILIPGFLQYENNFAIEDKKHDYIGMNGKGGSGKTQLAMSIFTEFTLAPRFGYSLASKIYMNPDYKFNDKMYLILKNTGDTNLSKTLEDQLPNKYKDEFEGFISLKRLSGSQTNYLKILRAARLALESNNHITVLLDETTSTVDEHTVKHILTSVPAVKNAISNGLFEVYIIDHNKESRRKVATEEIQLNFKFVENLKPIHGNITDKSLSPFIVTEKENQEIFTNIIDQKFFGSNRNKTAEIMFFEINEKKNILNKITEEKYNKTIAKFPNKAFSFSYVPRLCNPNNPKDKTGNIRYEYDTENVVFDNQSIIFKIGDAEVFTIISIKPKVVDGNIVYEAPDQIPFWYTKNLKKTNDEISLIPTVEMENNHTLLESEQPYILDLVGQATAENISESITDYYEEEIKNNKQSK
jgi:hypothetical protein